MNKLVAAAVLIAATFLPGFLLGDKKPQEPFYRKYLVPGNPLDERILAQEKRVEADPNSADLRNDFGNLLAARRFPKEAREQYETAMKLDKHHFLAPYNLGLLYEEEGEIGKAISAYEKSIERNRGFPPSRFRLGRLYERRGQDDNAVAQYARALQIDPGMRDPKRNPLIVDTRLLDRVSLENYSRNMAVAAMASDAAYSNPSMARKLPLDRTLSSGDLPPARTPATVETPGAPPPAQPTPVRVISQPNPGRRDVVRPAPGQNPNFNAPPPPTPDLVVLPEPESPSEETPPPPPTPSYPRGAPPPPAPLPTQTPE